MSWGLIYLSWVLRKFYIDVLVIQLFYIILIHVLLRNLLIHEEVTNIFVLDFDVKNIKKFPLEIKGIQPIDEVISTIGGISDVEINENFELKKFHSAMLSSGTLSMPVLEQHIQWFIEEELKKSTVTAND